MGSITLTAGIKPGFLSSLISKETSCGLTESPWILEAETGQKVNLTLMYFNWHDQEEGGSPCSTKLGYLFDLDSEDIVNICGSTSHTSHLHTTEGNRVQLLLDKAALADSHFIIKYEGRWHLLGKHNFFCINDPGVFPLKICQCLML